MPTSEEILSKVQEALVDALGVDDDEVTPEATLVGDLGAESIDFLDIVFRLEKAFEIKIPREELFPEDILTNEDYVQDGRVNQAGVAKLAERNQDVTTSELLRARSTLAKRRADLVRSEMAIKSNEDRLKALTNDPELLAGVRVELVPSDVPSMARMATDVTQAAGDALENRPEIRQAFEQYRAAMIRKNVAKNQALPQADLIVEMAMGGLPSSCSRSERRSPPTGRRRAPTGSTRSGSPRTPTTCSRPRPTSTRARG